MHLKGVIKTGDIESDWKQMIFMRKFRTDVYAVIFQNIVFPIPW